MRFMLKICIAHGNQIGVCCKSVYGTKTGARLTGVNGSSELLVMRRRQYRKYKEQKKKEDTEPLILPPAKLQAWHLAQQLGWQHR